ncbi:MAG: 16S rRNA (cytosine(967)-C(5))-methyltransferase [candidate division Zixibacteria bacterium RBG_16_50_21]|nr:MAG: 16S rRNA (cytosine(967)-C(5))-methyltransferase [candidate division Zixibacteria bacterium RBG_16_50_21]
MKTESSAQTKISARETALKALYKIEQEESFAEDTVEKLAGENRLSPPDRRLVAELVLGTTKMRKRIDFEIGFLLDQRIERLTPWIRNILRMGIYQFEFTDRIPEYAAVNEAVNLARKYGHGGVARLVNAVLRNYQRKKKEIRFPEDETDYLATFYSIPEWLIEKWLAIFDMENVVRLCHYFNQKPAVGVRINTLKSDAAEIEGYCKEREITIRKGIYAGDFYYLQSAVELEKVELIEQGKVYLQDEASLLSVGLLYPKAGETVLDLCAAPGGKSTYLAQKMENHGKIIAVDKSVAKIAMMKKNCQRLGVSMVETVLGDATDFKAEKVDKVLVDAPCSGTGVLHRNADARWRKNPQDLKRLPELQLKILENAISLVRQGGVIVYSTCSIMPEENQEVVERILSKHRELELEDAGKVLCSAVVTKEGYLRTLPFLHNIDGAFGARLVKK